MAYIHYSLLSVFIRIIHSQTEPFTSWTEPLSPLMPNVQATLLPGYYNGKIWLIGGSDTNPASNDEIWTYDPSGNFFDDLGQLPILGGVDNLNSQSSTQINEFIYFVHSDELYKFDMSTGKLANWTSAIYYTNIMAPCLASKDDRYVLLIGGENLSDGDDGSNRFQIYDTINDIWYAGDNLNSRRRRLTCSKSPDGNSLYVFGGTYECGLLNCCECRRTSIEKLDISNMNSVITAASQWGTITSKMKANGYFSRSIVDNVNNLIYIVGGRPDVGDPADSRIQIVDPTTDSTSLSSVELNTGRSSPAVIMVNQRIYVFGGSDSDLIGNFEVSNILTFAPTQSPTDNPTKGPTADPTPTPTDIPTAIPTNNPSETPTKSPTNNPSKTPSNIPTLSPSNHPTISPTDPTIYPTIDPTIDPTYDPTKDPTVEPTYNPTGNPTTLPTPAPTIILMFPTTSPTNNDPSNDKSTVNIDTTDSDNNNDQSKEIDNGSNIFDTNNDTFWFMVIGIVLFVLCCVIFIIFVFCWKKGRKLQEKINGMSTDESRGNSQTQRSTDPLKSSPSRSGGIGSTICDIGEDEDDDDYDDGQDILATAPVTPYMDPVINNSNNNQVIPSMLNMTPLGSIPITNNKVPLMIRIGSMSSVGGLQVPLPPPLPANYMANDGGIDGGIDTGYDDELYNDINDDDVNDMYASKLRLNVHHTAGGSIINNGNTMGGGDDDDDDDLNNDKMYGVGNSNTSGQ